MRPFLTTPAQRPLHILVAEDNRVNQLVVGRMLEKAGHRVDIVGDGREAVDAVRGTVYDLMLMDCLMPEMDGFEATRAIRAAEDGTGRHLPIIALTANAMPDRSRGVPRCGDGRLPHQTALETGAARGVGAVGYSEPEREPGCHSGTREDTLNIAGC